MRDTDEAPFDRYDTPFDDDEETHRVDTALDGMEARLAETGTRMDAIEVRLNRLERRFYWCGLWLTLKVLVSFDLITWWRAP